jgi:hypothetical protein
LLLNTPMRARLQDGKRDLVDGVPSIEERRDANLPHLPRSSIVF